MNTEDKEDKLARAYHKMVNRVYSALGEPSSKGQSEVPGGIEKAKQKAVELGELSEEEADQLGEYLRRDLQDAAKYLTDTGKALSDWLMLDLELIEEQLLNAFSQVADKTRLELAYWAEQARYGQDYHTGETIGMGTFACVNCGKRLYFHQAECMPPCPQCGHTLFKRLRQAEESS